MHTSIVWAESEDRSGAQTGIAGKVSAINTATGDTVQIPNDKPYVWFYYAVTSSDTYYPVRSTLTGAKLDHDFDIIGGLTLTTKAKAVYDRSKSPLKLSGGAYYSAVGVEEDEAGVAHVLGIALIVANGKINWDYTEKPNITHYVSCTGSANSAGVTWDESNALTPRSSPPSGKYRLWGAIFTSATIISARLVYGGERYAVIPRKNERGDIHPFNYHITKDGIEFNYNGGNMPITYDSIADTTDTPDDVTLLLEYLGELSKS